jgi:hypothetical protein
MFIATELYCKHWKDHREKLLRNFTPKYAGVYHKRQHSKILNFQNNVLPHINYASHQHLPCRKSCICHLTLQSFTFEPCMTLIMAAPNKISWTSTSTIQVTSSLGTGRATVCMHATRIALRYPWYVGRPLHQSKGQIESTPKRKRQFFRDYLLTLGKENFLLTGIMFRLENTIEDVTIIF